MEIPKENGKTRSLSIYSYEDKLVQEALRKVLESVLEPHFYNNMCGFRPNRNCHGAIRLLNDMIEGHKTNYILDADIKGFFDNLNHDWIMKFISSRITDSSVLRLVEKMLKAGILKNREFYVDEFGAGQGSVCSPINDNIKYNNIKGEITIARKLRVWFPGATYHIVHREVCLCTESCKRQTSI